MNSSPARNSKQALKFHKNTTTQKRLKTKDLNIKPKTGNLLEENTGEKFHDIGLGNNFLDMTRSTINKSEERKLGTISTKTFVHQKAQSTK